MSQIKVARYVLRVKNMHSWAPPDPWGPWNEEKLSYIHYGIKREEAKQCILKLASVFHHLPSVGPKQLCALAHLGCTRRVLPSYNNNSIQFSRNSQQRGNYNWTKLVNWFCNFLSICWLLLFLSLLSHVGNTKASRVFLRLTSRRERFDLIIQ